MSEEPGGLSPEMRQKIIDLLGEGNVAWAGKPPDFSLSKEDMDAKVKEPTFTEVSLSADDKGLGFRWHGEDIGFGCVDIYKNKAGKWVMDSEAMSNEFVCKMFLHFIEQLERV